MEDEVGNKIQPDMGVKRQVMEKNTSEDDLSISKGLKNSTEPEKAADLMQRPEVDSDRFFKLIDSSVQGLREYRLIVSALELGVFEALKTPLSAGVLAEKLGCKPALMPHFCEALCSLGLLDRFEEGALEEESNIHRQERNENDEKDGFAPEEEYEDKPEGRAQSYGSIDPDAVYLVSELSAAYLLERSPFSQQHYLAGTLRTVGLWNRLPEIIKNGPEIFEKGTFFGEVVQSMAENARCGMLQETVKLVAENVDLENIKKLLDLGGGHGLYAIAFARLNENLQAFVFDLLPVTEKTKEFIEKYGAANVKVIPGDFFKDEIGDGYDLIFSSFNPGGKVPSLIPKISRALNPGGIFVTRQMPDEKMKSSPLLSLDWNLWTFEGVKKGGSGYSFENSVPFNEYIDMLGNYGLEVFHSLDMKEGSRIVFARKTG
ncbi:SAM-dependent methyltransferase [Methanosarcina sp. MSH10X1]|uniref:methyltransferase n=1 Tax=Methanosarcina sp. MSH10X1 TaxID=2507075 RepID=UPI000FFB154E|nr:methyltransferase [Methanosarcina sp. MSH10X1]RXA19935.1 SAM-dependent methyltransferase [Methanosarcina sp. MSH10X1]